MILRFLPRLIAAAAAVAAAGPALAGDATVGGKLFLQCRACHKVTADGASGVGPNLYGVVGAKAGAKPGYVASPALAKSGLVWTPANLDRFLAKPTAVVPGTRMAFAGIASAKTRDDLIAYLATLQPPR